MRLHGQRAGNGDSLLLPAGELLRIGVCPIGQADALEQSPALLFRLAPLLPAHIDGRFDDVFQRREVREQLIVLKHHANQLPHGPNPPGNVSRPRIEQVGPDADLSGVPIAEPVDAAQQGRFAAAAGPQYGYGLTGSHGETHLVQHQTLAESFGETGDVDQRIVTCGGAVCGSLRQRGVPQRRSRQRER